VILGTENARGREGDGDPSMKATLDDLFRRALARRPDAVALIDPPDRASFTDGPVRRLTYAEADRAISALAARLRGFGLPVDSVVATQLPNTVDGVIALLAILRAGLIAAPLPLLWRHADAATALGRVAARALIGCNRIHETLYGDLAMHIAMETFTIRFLCGFGEGLPDGVVSVDDIFEHGAEPPAVERFGAAADHVAVVTFDVTADGLIPVARSHAELVAGGLAVHLEARIDNEAAILAALAPGSFASIATTIVPWLLSAGTLVLHHPFTTATFAEQSEAERCTVTVLPGPMVATFAEAGLIGGERGTVLSIWRSPERIAGSPIWPSGGADLVDVLVFGEMGLVPARRGADGKALAMPNGRALFPQGSGQGVALVNTSRGPAGSLWLSGPLVPHAAFPPGADRGGAPKLKVTHGVVDTGYPCKLDRISNTLTIDGPQPGLINVGGYRFLMRDLQALVAGIEDGSSVAAFPDPLAGHRLSGIADDREAICQALLAHGANPLLVAAFRARSRRQQSAA